jgi:hypothetical protein
MNLSQLYSKPLYCHMGIWFIIKLKTKLHGLSPQANYTDRLSDHRLSANLVPTLADRGCRVVSAMIPPQSFYFGFLDRSRYFLEIAPQLSSRG